MKCIYEASSGLEAHMILNLLQQHGIESRIDGEYLQGGAGELQAMNMVRVLVNEVDYTSAQSVIDEWDSTQIEKTEIPVQATNSKSSAVAAGLFIGLIAGAGITYSAYNTPVSINGIDHNDDGKMDEKWIYRDDRISSIEIDRNLDGVIDLVSSYNRKGRIYKSKLDDNFDGVFESLITYERGNPILTEVDIDNDGAADHRTYFRDGVFYKVEIFDPASGVTRKIQNYKLNKLVSSSFDSDGDGIFDKKYEYDFYEEIK
jgi:hypothetical protein